MLYLALLTKAAVSLPQEGPLHASLTPPATLFWAPGTVEPTLLPPCLSSSWEGVSIQPGNTFSWDL